MVLINYVLVSIEVKKELHNRTAINIMNYEFAVKSHLPVVDSLKKQALPSGGSQSRSPSQWCRLTWMFGQK